MAAELYSENLLANGDFEDGVDQWTVSPAFEAATIQTILDHPPEEKESGRHALKIRNVGGWSNVYHDKRLPMGGVYMKCPSGLAPANRFWTTRAGRFHPE